jgi:hypothetical protein
MQRVLSVCSVVAIVAISLVIGAATPALAGDIPETETLPLFLLGLFVTLMVFRVQTASAGRGATKKARYGGNKT